MSCNIRLYIINSPFHHPFATAKATMRRSSSSSTWTIPWRAQKEPFGMKGTLSRAGEALA